MRIKIITVPHSLLREKSKPVGKIDKKIKKLVGDLIETARAAENPKGVGLSAVQIGKPVRIFVIKRRGKFAPFVNPEIVWRSKKMFSAILKKNRRFLEGCLSLPFYYGFVDRPSAVKLTWQDLENTVHEEKFKNHEAAYVQHELDHLDGILFVDRILKEGGKIYKREKDKEGKEVLTEVEFK